MKKAIENLINAWAKRMFTLNILVNLTGKPEEGKKVNNYM